MVEFRGYDFGPATPGPGMDHPYYPTSSLPDRPALRWPGSAPLAVGALVILEHYEWDPPADAYGLRQPSGGLMKLPGPDYVQLTHREYGHRVGVFRVLDVLDELRIPATVAVDALTATHYPWLIDHLLGRGCELIAHGVAASRLITSKLSETAEAEMIGESLDALAAFTGQRPRGWFSPEGVESYRTPHLVADAGVEYICDWPNDEQPFPMTVGDRQLTSIPLNLELDDEFALWRRRATLDSWVSMIHHSVDQLYADGTTNGRLLMFTLRPWLIGQPFRIGYLRHALATVKDLGPLFMGTAGTIVDAYLAAQN